MGMLLRLAAGAGIALALAACQPSIDVGYVEIKTVPASTNASQPVLYLDTVKIEALKKGSAVLTQRVGTVKLATDGGGGHQTPICELIVKKNRITTVTISVLERPLRCQCRNAGGGSRTCIS
jgi:hypothetical protein